MSIFPEKLSDKLQKRVNDNALRSLPTSTTLVDFSSNDYLGFSRSDTIYKNVSQKLLCDGKIQNGATGSRLLTGNHPWYLKVEAMLCNFHQAESALVFNSGYDANLGFFSSVPQRGDIVLYDEYIHASIRDGLQLCRAKAYKFKHNDLGDMEKQLQKFSNNDVEAYVVTESVFSMDGDSPDLEAMLLSTENHKAHLVVDEAHAVGVFGENGGGLVQELGLQKQVFARIVTFGKALGCHGAVVLGCKELKGYLVNFARSLIYTTGLPPHSLVTVYAAYDELQNRGEKSLFKESKEALIANIQHFKKGVDNLGLHNVQYIESNSAIQCFVISGNTVVKKIVRKLCEKGFDVRPILSPTVPVGKERIRFCLHNFNTFDEISGVLKQFI